MRKQNVSQIVDYKLCIACGACYAICPFNAIDLRISSSVIPEINEMNCRTCKLCIATCPSAKNSSTMLEQPEALADLIGLYKKFYLGYASDHSTRFMGSSGGVTTALLIWALKKGIIDGAIVAVLEGTTPKAIIAETVKDLKRAAGSKYLPIPVNQIIRKLLEEKRKVAFIGLPCHLKALDQLIRCKPSLKEKIAFKIGLFCGRGFDLNFLLYVLHKYCIDQSNISRLGFRGYGWPGRLHVEMSSDSVKRVYIKYSEYGKYSGSYFFMPRGCLVCPDFTAELADISLGDAWLKDIIQSDSEGTSLIISRTELGSMILHKASKEGVLDLSEISAEATIHSQSAQLIFHKVSLKGRILLMKILGLLPEPSISGVSVDPIINLYNISLIIGQVLYDFLCRRKKTLYIPHVFLLKLSLYYHVLNGLLRRRYLKREKIV